MNVNCISAVSISTPLHYVKLWINSLKFVDIIQEFRKGSVCVITSSSIITHLHQHLTCSVFHSGVEVSGSAFTLWWTRENVHFGPAAPKANSSGTANQRRAGPPLFQPSWHQCIHWWSRWSTNQVQHLSYRTKKRKGLCMMWSQMRWRIKHCKNLKMEN